VKPSCDTARRAPSFEYEVDPASRDPKDESRGAVTEISGDPSDSIGASKKSANSDFAATRWYACVNGPLSVPSGYGGRPSRPPTFQPVITEF